MRLCSRTMWKFGGQLRVHLMFKVCKVTLAICQAGPRGALMSFNTDKCVVLRPHSWQTKINNVQYQLNGEHLRSVRHKRDLGVIVDEKLKPHRQCAKAAKSANSITRAIKASFMKITPLLFDKFYGTFLHPHLEYSLKAWRPVLRKDIKLLEDVRGIWVGDMHIYILAWLTISVTS